jgi:hypothetical protein
LEENLDLPRPAFYFIAAFILSSVVRYQPELLVGVSDPDSEQGLDFGNGSEHFLISASKSAFLREGLDNSLPGDAVSATTPVPGSMQTNFYSC